MWRISSSCCTCSSRSVKLTVNHLMWRISSSHSSSSVNHLMWRMRSQPPFFPPTLLIEARAAKRRRHVSCSTRQRGSLTSDKQTSRALKVWLGVTALMRFQHNHPLSLPSLTNLTLQGRRHIDVCKKASSTTGAKELKGRIGNKREVTRSQHLRATRSALCQKKSVASGKLGGRALRCNCEPFTSSNLSN